MTGNRPPHQQLTLKFVSFSSLPKEQPKPYTYTPLEPGFIRTIRVHPMSESVPLLITIDHDRLDEPHLTYTALSYVWGSAELTHRIKCNSNTFVSVTSNAASALQHIRRKTKPIYVWIDALCIDQSNIAERNAQVRLMGNIYAKATMTYVYLGVADDESRVAMKYIKEHDHNGRQHATRLRSGFELERKALGSFLDRTWFNRIWVLQEVFLSRNAKVMCGEEEVRWVDLLSAYNFLLKNRNLFDWPYLPPVLGLKSRRYLWDLLCLTRQCCSTDPRDKVFALLSMTKTEGDKVEVDYNMDCGQLYVNVAVHLFRSGGLDFLLAAQHFPSDIEVPSWVPNWSLRFDVSHVSAEHRALAPFERAGGFYAAADICTIDSSNHVKGIVDGEMSVPRNPILRVQAMIMGGIVAMDDVRIIQGSEWGKELRLIGSRFRDCTGHRVKWSDVLGNGCQCCVVKQKGLPIDIAWRTMTAGRAGNKRPVGAISTTKAEIVGSTVNGCRLFITKCGHMGLTPGNINYGDYICILKGAWTPCIVRRIESDFWVLVAGYCYLDGAMKGEVVAGQLGDEAWRELLLR
ncbi:heterokaryon incompatibility protein-domain-containing protein [Paraphoma chrysanthemicola]|uniref:Heterokaryon incompatibility protein-domain-containing protein n=1 Tax=Paraphoma chrysanthemicola TaxID=798071 RepID=A0A8K0RDP9_9PLEO|nr:heterokaryon incompatibility protein-domain-containing protein [Paraphoma chrysanthemicola]